MLPHLQSQCQSSLNSTPAKELDTSLGDMGVVNGAAVHAAALTGYPGPGFIESKFLLASTIRSIGIETGAVGGVVLAGGDPAQRGVVPLIARMSTTPCRKSETFS